MTEKKIVLIDGNSYIHRAYHAIPRLTDPEGNLVNAVFGMLKMLKKIITEERPSHIMVAFDHPKPTFRHKEFKDYKANRPPTDSELIEQFPKVFDILETLNIKYINYEGFEADDIIATLTSESLKENIPVSIVTSDKDILQLVDDNVRVINSIKSIVYELRTFKKLMGIDPCQITDYLALIGDSSDNLPGVRGIGPVTAKKLLSEYSNLNEIYDNLHKIKEKVRSLLKTYKEDAYTTRRMVKLVENLDLPLTPNDCLWRGPDAVRLREKLLKLNFSTIIPDWMETWDGSQFQIENSPQFPKIKVITEIKDLNKFFSDNASKKEIVLEVYFYDMDEKNLLGLGMGFNIAQMIYVPLGHSYLGVEKQMKDDALVEVFKKNEIYNKNFIAYNIKDTYKFFKKNEIVIKKPVLDVVTAEYILSADSAGKNLKEVSSKYLDWVPEEIEHNYSDSKISEVAEKVSMRLSAVFELSRLLPEKMRNVQGSEKLFYDVEMPVAKILGEMELSGVRIDTGRLKEMEFEFRKKISTVEDEIFEIAGEKFNINSSKQLARLLFHKLKLPPVRKTKTGFSTAEDVLHNLKNEHPLPEKLLRYRELQKLISTYVDPLPKKVDSFTGRIHTTFNITGTATGRLSSNDPNLQNIPVKTNEGSLIRRAFIPSADKIFLSADYSQIDLRVLAHISGDENLIKSFINGEDVHTSSAMKIFGVDEGEVTQEMRKKSKTINFGIVYGMSSWGLSKRVALTEEESSKFIEKYFNQYPLVKK